MTRLVVRNDRVVDHNGFPLEFTPHLMRGRDDRERPRFRGNDKKFFYFLTLPQDKVLIYLSQ